MEWLDRLMTVRQSPAPAVVRVRFRVPFTRDELVEAFTPDALEIAKLPNLKWKIWTFDDADREFASVYLFDDRASADTFVKGDIIAGLYKDPNLSDVRVAVHDVLPSLSRATRAPID